MSLVSLLSSIRLVNICSGTTKHIGKDSLLELKELTELQTQILKRICESDDKENVMTLQRALKKKDHVTVWQSVKSLENKAFITITRDPERKNANILRPTEKGIFYTLGYIGNCLLADNYIKVIEQVEDAIERLSNKIQGLKEQKGYSVFVTVDLDGRKRVFSLFSKNTKEEKATLQMAYGSRAKSFVDHGFFNGQGKFFIPYINGKIERKDWDRVIAITADSNMHPLVFEIILEYINDESLRKHIIQTLDIRLEQTVEKLQTLLRKYPENKNASAATRKIDRMKQYFPTDLFDKVE